ncbi:hypothetical protein [Bradyrhizobium ottawaense]|uniref:hypothetical protein n=1 Tax=Bradyrhizobium ottawaense TaxID=931866 RepID=UPI0027D5E942|nr:hypothetical protein BwSF19_74760 [Bradyrhizobium ottawaense]
MKSADWLPWISLAINFATVLAIFIARNWLRARLEKGVQHGFDRKIEQMRAELRQSEERLKSGLRDRETEIASLRSTLLSGSAGRQAMLDKRRFEAVERIWTAVNDMAPLIMLSGMMAVMNVIEVEKEIRDPKMKQFLGIIGRSAPSDPTQLKNVARDEQPFVPELAWAYFSAYSSILYGNLMTFKALENGVEPTKILKKDANKNILKAALPHQSQWIDQTEPQMYHFLLEELQGNLLKELRKILDGADASKAEIEKARQILDAVKRSEAGNIEVAAAMGHTVGT